jgi:serine/threonine protein kinase
VQTCDAGDLHELFGPLLGGEHFRFRTKLQASLRAEVFVPLLFSKGIGEKLANVLESLHESAACCHVRLSALETLGTLGSGGFGKVIKVMDTHTGEVYAMKLQNKDRTTKFAMREAQALHTSHHAFIVRLVQIFHTKIIYVW